jgi:hypothetical protein
MNNRTTISKFDQHNFEGHPPPCTLVICIFGFATTKIIGFDPREARQGDLVIDVALLGFFIITTIWLKAFIMTGAGSSLTQVTLGFSMYLDGPIIKNERSHRLHENLNNIIKLGDIWLPLDPAFVGRMCKVFQA